MSISRWRLRTRRARRNELAQKKTILPPRDRPIQPDRGRNNRTSKRNHFLSQNHRKGNKMNYILRRVTNLWEATNDDEDSPIVAFGETPDKAIMNFMDLEIMRLKADTKELIEELQER